MRFDEKIVLILGDKSKFLSQKIRFGEKILLTLEDAIKHLRVLQKNHIPS